MSAIKTLFKYVVIILCAILFLIFLLTGILFIFPNASIFGFRYVTNHNDYGGFVDNATVTEINIETNNYDIVIIPNSRQDIQNYQTFSFVVENNYTGFSNAKVKAEVEGENGNETKDVSLDCTWLQALDGSYVKSTELNSVTLAKFRSGSAYTFKLIEPTGLVSIGSSRVMVYMPENSTNYVKYNLKTNSGTIKFLKNDINLNSTLYTSDITLDINSYRGAFNLENIVMKENSNLRISNYLGKVNIDSEKIGNVIIDSNSGNFTFNNIGFGENKSNLTINGNNPYVKVNKLYGNLYYDANTGYLEAGEVLGDMFVDTDNGIIKVAKALGVIDVNNDSGETTIDQIGENTSNSRGVNLTSKSGKITIGGSNYSENKGVYYIGLVKTESGNVVVNNFYAKAGSVLSSNTNEINTTSGSVTVNFATSEDIKDLTVTTTSGKVKLYKVYATVNVKTNNGAVYAEFDKIAVANVANFESLTGNLEIKLPAPTNSLDKQYNINAQNKENKLDIKIGSFAKTAFDGDKNLVGYYIFEQKFPSDASTTNTINLKTNSGKIIVKEN